VRTIVQKGNVELLKGNLVNFNAAEVPAIFTYVISSNNEAVATEMVKVLLAYKGGSDPGANGHKAIITAVEKGFIEIVRLLVDDPRVDPSINNDQPLKFAHKNGLAEIKAILLSDFRVDPSALNE